MACSKKPNPFAPKGNPPKKGTPPAKPGKPCGKPKC